MGNPIKIKAKLKGDVAEVKALMPHPMESGVRVNADTGEKVPKHYIRKSSVNITAMWSIPPFGAPVYQKTRTWRSNLRVPRQVIPWKSAGGIIPVIPA